MRVTISHNKSKEEVMRSVDRAFDDMFQGVSGLPVRVVPEQRNWQGSKLVFALTAKMGLLSTPIQGYVEVSDHDLTIDADLGFFERMISTEKARELIGGRLRGLLN